MNRRGDDRERTPAQRRLVVAASALAAVAFAILVWNLNAADRVLRLATIAGTAESGWVAPPACAPNGLIDWQLAGSAERVQELLSCWQRNPQAIPAAQRSLELDRAFPWAYGVVLSLALWLLLKPAAGRRPVLWVLNALPAGAVFCDLCENELMAEELRRFGQGEPLSATLVGVVTVLAVLKFLFLAAALITLTFAASAWLCFQLGRSRLRKARPAEEVLAAEARYREQRRALAGLPEPADGDSRPVGLALSGGGIRSATLSLGVLQALARRGILPHFDYLCTVSGGGYIGSALSSLLSRNRRDQKRDEDEEARYRFGPEDEALFSTRAEDFPFGTAAESDSRDLCAQVQMRHLAASGEYLMRRKGFLSQDFLRVVGSLTWGSLYHAVHFGLLFTTIAAGYLWVVFLMVGANATQAGRAALQEKGPDAASYTAYLREAAGWVWDGGPLGAHPFAVAFTVGVLVTLITVLLGQRLIQALDSRWFRRRGRSRLEVENQVSVLALILVQLLNAVVLTTYYVRIDPDAMLNISIPLVSYLGGAVVLFARHVMGRQDFILRARLSARAGAVACLIAVSIVLILFVLPFLAYFDSVVDRLDRLPTNGVVTWLLSLVGARLFATAGEGAPGQPTSRLGSALQTFRKAASGILMVVAILGAMLLISALIWKHEAHLTGWMTAELSRVNDDRTATAWARFGLAISALAAWAASGLVSFNKLSLYLFYRDRLAEAFLRTHRQDGEHQEEILCRDDESMHLHHLHGSPDPFRSEADGSEKDDSGKAEAEEDPPAVTAAPYHLLVTCLNLTSDGVRRRRSDHFLFSKLYCGSETTGYCPTRNYRDGGTSLARAMTISGAAASPAMGRRSFFAQSAAMALLNVRLGQWMENPGYDETPGRRKSRGWVFWPLYLLREALGSTDANQRLVYLSDGAHTGDNLGLCPLLRRRCRLIVVVDAEHDPAYRMDSFYEAVAQIRGENADFEVDLDLDPLRPDAGTGRSAAQVAVGRIHYGAGEEGRLVYLKSALTDGAPDAILAFARCYKDFPQQPTSDQFFDEAQFEAYRSLGEHIAEQALDGELGGLLGGSDGKRS